MGILTQIANALGFSTAPSTQQGYQAYDPAALYAQQQLALGVPQYAASAYGASQYGVPYNAQQQFALQQQYGAGVQNYGMDSFYAGGNMNSLWHPGFGTQQSYDPYNAGYFGNQQQTTWPYGLPVQNDYDPFLGNLQSSVLPASDEEINKAATKFAKELRENSGDVHWTWNFDHDIKAKNKEILRVGGYYAPGSILSNWTQIGDGGSLGVARTNNSVYNRWFGQYGGTPNPTGYAQALPYNNYPYQAPYTGYNNQVPYDTGGIKWPTYM